MLARFAEIDGEHTSLKRPVFQLGRIAFVVDCDDSQFQNELSKLLPRANEISHHVHRITCVPDLRAVINCVLQYHSDCIWIDAACLRTPQGRSVLISGQSGAGKSTTAMALALAHGWEVLAGDITLIDETSDRIIKFSSPFSLKKGTADLLISSIGKAPEPIVLGEWTCTDGGSTHGECTRHNDYYKAAFDLTIHLEMGGNTINHCSLNPAEYVRLILRCSNLTRIEAAPEKLAEYVSFGACHHVAGGSLIERLKFITDLAR